MSRALQILAGWKGYALVLAIGLALGWGGAWKVRDGMAAEAALKAAQAQARAATDVIGRTQQAAIVSEDVGRAVEAAQVETRIVYRTITERIPVYVTPETDRAVVLPLGFVRLHDAAAAGTVAALPDRAGQPADAPSGIALSAAAGTIVGNYGTCLDWRNQVIGWQGWYAEQSASWGKGPVPNIGTGRDPPD